MKVMINNIIGDVINIIVKITLKRLIHCDIDGDEGTNSGTSNDFSDSEDDEQRKDYDSRVFDNDKLQLVVMTLIGERLNKNYSGVCVR